MPPDSYEEVHLKLADGTTVYWPKGDMTRLAPAAVCNIAGRIVELRKLVKNLGPDTDPELRRKLEELSRPIPFEDKFLSGKSIEVHNALKQHGAAVTADQLNNMAGRHFLLLNCCGCLRPHVDGAPGTLCTECAAREERLRRMLAEGLLVEEFIPIAAPEFTERIDPLNTVILECLTHPSNPFPKETTCPKA